MQLSARERILSMAVGVTALILVSAFVFDYFLKNRARLQTDLARNSSALSAMRRQLAEKPIWDQRAAWLQAKQPTLTSSEDVATGELLDLVKETARKNSVQISTQSLRPANHQPEYSSISVEIDTTSTWQSMIAFMREMQGPERFIVFEGADLKVDEKDATQMRANFKIAKWFAARGKLK